MNNDIWRRSKRIESEYLKSLLKLCDIFKRIASSSGGDQEKYVRRMRNFQNSVQYEKYITSAVKRMVTPLDVANQSTWRKAAKKATKGKFLYGVLVDELQQGGFRIIQNQIIENVSLIRTLPEDTASKVVQDIAENALKGKRAKSIESIIRQEPYRIFAVAMSIHVLLLV